MPKLESIELRGHWTFEKRLLEVLCLAVAPNLRWVTFKGECVGLTLQECVALARRMPQVGMMHLDLTWTRNEIQELGLIHEKDLLDGQRNGKRVEYCLDEDRFYDVLGF